MSTFIVTPRDAVDINQLRSLLDTHRYTDLLDKNQHTFKPYGAVVVWLPYRQDVEKRYATRCFEHLGSTDVESVSVNELARHLCQ